MDFFGIGFGELILILLLALIIWGPKRVPEIARNLGKTVRALRRATHDFTAQVTREIDLEEREKPRKEIPPPPRGSPEKTRKKAEDER
jgi:sec-independent protein translocase protein TatA